MVSINKVFNSKNVLSRLMIRAFLLSFFAIAFINISVLPNIAEAQSMPVIDAFTIPQTSGEYTKTITGVRFTDDDADDTLEAHWYPSGLSNCNRNSYDTVVVNAGNGVAIDLSDTTNAAGRTGDILFFIPENNTAAQWGSARYICVGVTDGTNFAHKVSTDPVGNGNLVKNSQPVITFNPSSQDTSAKTTFDLTVSITDSNSDQTIEAEYKIINGGSSCDLTTTETGETDITTTSTGNGKTATITFNQESDNGKKVCVTARDTSGIPETETTGVGSARIRESQPIAGIDLTAPSLDNEVEDQTATVGLPFVFELPSDIFSDSNTITYTSSGEGSGITFRSSDNSWRGIPTEETTLRIIVTATDALGNTTTDEFDIVIGPNTSGVVPSSPGGVLAGLSFWLSALFSTGADSSGTLTAWADISPNLLGIDDIEINGTPKLIENGINFNPAVDLVNEENIPKSYFLINDEYLLKGDDDFTAVVVVAPDHVNRQATLISGTNNQSVQFRLVEGRPALHSRSNGGDIIKSTTGSKVSVGNAAILGVRRDGDNYSVYQDGRSFSGTNTTTLSTDSSTFRISGHQSNRQNLSGDLGEVFIYNDNLADADLAKVFTNLAIKYGVTLNSEIANYVNSAGTSVYDNSAYNNTVIAIAKDESLGVDQRISKSAKDGSILTVSTDNNFTSTNKSHPSLNDGQYLVIGHNGGVSSQTTETPAGFSYRTVREWKVGNTGSVGAVNLKFEGDYNQGDFLVTDADGDFSTGAVEVGALNADGEIEATLTNGDYFILAAKPDSLLGGLATLVPSTGTSLSPSFSPTTEAYTITIPPANISFSLTPTLSRSDTSLTVNGESIVSGEVVELPVLGGLNTTRIVETSANGYKTKEYTVSFSRNFKIRFADEYISSNGVFWDDGETETISFITSPALAPGENIFDYKITAFPRVFASSGNSRLSQELRATFTADDVEVIDATQGILRLPYDVEEIINSGDIGLNKINIAIEEDPGTNSYTYSVPTGRYFDGDGRELTYTSSGEGNGITFNEATNRWEGTPTTAVSTPITVAATDSAGNIATDDFDIVIAAGSSSDPSITITSPIATDNYVNDSEDNNDITIAGTSTNIPDGGTITVVFSDVKIPAKTDTVSSGAWSVVITAAEIQAAAEGIITVTATYSTATTSRTFVYDATAPSLDNEIQEILSHIGQAYTFPLPENTFSDANKITYTSSGEGNGISFNTSTNTWEGTPTSGGGFTAITVTATDAAGNTKTDSFNITRATLSTTNLIIRISTPISSDNYVNDAEDESAVTISGTSLNIADSTSITITISDNDLNTADVVKTPSVSANAWSTSITSAELKGLVQGEITIEAEYNSASATRTFIYDRTAPELQTANAIDDQYTTVGESFGFSLPTGTSFEGSPNLVSVVVDDQDIKYSVPDVVEAGVPLTLSPTTEEFGAFRRSPTYSYRGGATVGTPGINEVYPGLFLNTSNGVISGTPEFNPAGVSDTVLRIFATDGEKTARTTIVIPRLTLNPTITIDEISDGRVVPGETFEITGTALKVGEGDYLDITFSDSAITDKTTQIINSAFRIEIPSSDIEAAEEGTITVTVTHQGSGISATQTFIYREKSSGGGGGSLFLSGSLDNIAPTIPDQYGPEEVTEEVEVSLPTTAPMVERFLNLKFKRDLSVDTEGNDVRELQEFLNNNGFPVSSSGAGSKGQETNYFGPATQKALAEYQKVNDIPETGYLGQQTRRSIQKSIIINEIVRNIISIQNRIKELQEREETSKIPTTAEQVDTPESYYNTTILNTIPAAPTDQRALNAPTVEYLAQPQQNRREVEPQEEVEEQEEERSNYPAQSGDFYNMFFTNPGKGRAYSTHLSAPSLEGY